MPEDTASQRGWGSCLKSHSQETLESGFKLRSGCSQSPTLQPSEAPVADGEQEEEGAGVPPSPPSTWRTSIPGQLNNLSSSAPAQPGSRGYFYLRLQPQCLTEINRASGFSSSRRLPICLHL